MNIERIPGHVIRTGLVVLFCTVSLGACREKSYDTDFDAHVANPAYTNDHPRVLFDEAHHNRHTSTTGYKPFADLLRKDGYEVERGREPFSRDELAAHEILVIVGAMGLDDEGDDPAFTSEEVEAVATWVESGGSLLLIVDHYPFGDAASAMAERFGVSIGRGYTEDSVHFDEASGDTSQLVFSFENALLVGHPITHGRNDSERVERVATFTGTSLRGPDDEVLLRLSTTAIDYEPSVKVERSGGDTRVLVEYVNPAPTAGNGQAFALAVGKGRVVVMGEAAALTAQRSGYNGAPIGMNLKGFDNRQFALNVMHWLSRGL